MNQRSNLRLIIFSFLLLLADEGCGKHETTSPEDNNGSALDPRIKWRFTTEAGLFGGGSSPAIGPDGTIYVGTGAVRSYTGDRSALGIYAISPTGILRWKYATGKDMFTPAVGDDGTIYVQDNSSSLYALNPDGTLKWMFPLNTFSDVGFVTPAIDSGGTIYIGADAVYAIDPRGIQKWVYKRVGTIRTSPAISPHGTIYVGVNGVFGDYPLFGPALWAINRDGTLKWECVLQGAGSIFSSPAIGTDGTIYVGTERGSGEDLSFVFAINPNGTLKWTYTITGRRPVRSSPSIGTDGIIYVGTKASATTRADVLALNPDGTLKWKYTVEQLTGLPDDVYTPPAIGADGTIYFGAENRMFYAVGSDGLLAWKLEIGSSGSGPAILSDGTVYATAFNWDGNPNNIGTGTLYALKSSSTGLANSAWPKFHHDNRNAGRLNR